MERIVERNPAQAEFHQAVGEVADSIWPVFQRYPEFQEANIMDRMVEAERVIIFRVPWVDDQGIIRVNRGFRVEMNSAIGPYKGGLRFRRTVKLGVLKILAPVNLDPNYTSYQDIFHVCHTYRVPLVLEVQEELQVKARALFDEVPKIVRFVDPADTIAVAKEILAATE